MSEKKKERAFPIARALFRAYCKASVKVLEIGKELFEEIEELAK